MKSLFVWSGGGFPGLDIHAGIWMALGEAGIQSTHNSGCSAGAIAALANSSKQWTGPSFANFLSTLTERDVRRKRLAWQIRMNWIDHIYDNDRMLALLKRILPDTWDKIEKPTWIWATKMANSRKVDVSDPSLSPTPALAALASAAVPMIFPGVTLSDGWEYWDGGLRFNLPLVERWTEFDEVYLLIASAPVPDYRADGGCLTRAIRALKILMHDQILDVLDSTAAAPRVKVIWPNVWDKAPGFLRFDHSLISRSYELAQQQLCDDAARKG